MQDVVLFFVVACLSFTAASPGSSHFVEQWVAKVTSFSSEYTIPPYTTYAASQVIGPPDVYPQYGAHDRAWFPRINDSLQFLELKYLEEVYITSVDVYETSYAGQTTAILAKDGCGHWIPLWDATQFDCVRKARIFSPISKKFRFKTRHIRIEVNCTICGSWPAIDAVKLVGRRELPSSITNRGRDFAVALLQPDFLAQDARIFIDATSDQDATIVVSSPSGIIQKITYRVAADSGVSIPVPSGIVPRRNTTTRGIILLHSDVDISVSASIAQNSSRGFYSMAAFLVYPLTSAGTEFFLPSYAANAYGRYYSEFGVIGLYNNTVYHISYPGSGKTVSSTVHGFSLVQHQFTHDVSGAHVHSDKPVLVFSGVQQAHVTPNIQTSYASDFMAVQVPPVSTWGSVYIVPRLPLIRRYILRIFSSEDNTNIQIYNNDTHGAELTTLNEGMFYERNYSTFKYYESPTVVVADKPVSVYVYSYQAKEDSPGDASMTIIPSITQYTNDYRFQAPALTPRVVASLYYYVSVIIQTSESRNLYLGAALIRDNTLATYDTVPAPYENYTVVYVPVPQGYNRVTHHDSRVVFGVLVHGIANFEQYSFTAGLKLEHQNCRIPAQRSLPVPSSASTTLHMTASTTVAAYNVTYVTPNVPRSTYNAPSRNVTYVTPNVPRSTHNAASSNVTYVSHNLPTSTHSARTLTYVTQSATRSTHNAAATNVTYVTPYLRTTQKVALSTVKSSSVIYATPRPPMHTQTVTAGPVIYVTPYLPKSTLTTTAQTGPNVTTHLLKSTQTATGSTVPYVTPRNRNGKACFQCADVSHLELCDNIETCPENEICYLERYINTAGHTLYRSGCKDAMTCNVQRADADPVKECVTCCSGHLCNSAGCGDSGFPPRGARGPVCYDCPHVRSVNECHRVSVCQLGQVCSIEEYPLGDHSHFKLGCVHETCHYLKRATPRCHNCCNHDYCNANCTQPDIPFGGSFVG